MAVPVWYVTLFTRHTLSFVPNGCPASLAWCDDRAVLVDDCATSQPTPYPMVNIGMDGLVMFWNGPLRFLMGYHMF